MTIYYGSKEIKELYFGSQKIESLSIGNISIPVVSTVTFTLIPDPADATVVLTAAGYTQVGNSISVAPGTTITYTVSKEGYETQTGTQVCTINSSFNCTLSGKYTITINPIPSDAIVTMSVGGQTIDTTTIQKTTLYAWSLNSEVIYTISETPAIGDTIYNQDGTATTQKVIAVDGTDIEIG